MYNFWKNNWADGSALELKCMYEYLKFINYDFRNYVSIFAYFNCVTFTFFCQTVNSGNIEERMTNVAISAWQTSLFMYNKLLN